MLTPEQQTQLALAGVPSRHWRALAKGKPYVPTGMFMIIRLVNGVVSKERFKSAAELSSALSKLRLNGVPMSKAALGILGSHGIKLSPQEKRRAEQANSRRR